MSTALSPVTFHGDTIYCIAYQNQPYTAMKPIVENLGLGWASQSQKLNSNKGRWGVTIIVIPSSSGEQNTLCMPVRKLPAYLASINPNKVRPELREKIIRYQNECDDVLWDYWMNKWTAQQSDDLSIEARRPLSVLIGQWAGKAKISFPDCWRELHTVFGISTVGELPSSQLPAAMAWVQAKIDGLPSSVPAVAPERKPAKPVPVARELKDLMAAQSKIDLLIQLVQLGGLRGFSTADDPTMQALVKSRNEHIRAASNCLIMAKQAIKAALA